MGIKVNSVYNEDCLQTMKRMRSNYVDLVVTSPPYDDLRDYKNTEANNFPFEEIANELLRVLKTGGVIVWVVGDRIKDGSKSLTSFKHAIYFQSIGFTIHDTMIYKKNYFKNVNPNRYYQTHEHMFIISKGKPKTYNLLRDRKNKSAGQKNHGTQRMKDGSITRKSNEGKVIGELGLRGNVWEYTSGLNHSTKDKFAFEHPAIMPELLAEDHILTWSNKKNIVYDPFAGSGTVGKIAKLEGRRYILSELAKEYIPIIKKRLQSKTRVVRKKPIILCCKCKSALHTLHHEKK